MILHEKTREEFGYTFNTAKTRQNIYCQCDYCLNVFFRSKAKLITGHKNIIKDCCGNKKCIQLKKEEVFVLKYNTKDPGNSPEGRAKARKTCRENLGVDNPAQSPKVQSKIKTTCERIYGHDHPCKSDVVKIKTKKTCEERYGKDCYFKTDEFKIKAKETCEKVHNVDHPSKTRQGVENRKQFYLKNHGVENCSQIKSIQQKKIDTSNREYGVDHYSQTQEFIDRVKQTSRKNWDKDYYLQTDECKERSIKTRISKCGKPYYSQTKEFWEKVQKTLSEKNQPPKYTKTQNSIKEWLLSFNYYFTSNYTVLEGKEIDLYNETVKLGIEYCGLYWHCEKSPEPRMETYHFNKYKGCLKKGVELITLFEDEWIHKQKICESSIKRKLGIYSKIIDAENCIVEEVEKSIFDDFCEENDISGKCDTSMIVNGLYCEEELVGIISFGICNSEIFLLRCCLKNDIQIVGGIDKIFKHSLQAIDKKYKKIITYTDNRWFTGSTYQELGFVLTEETLPNCSYVDFSKRATRCSENNEKNNLPRIWDCGKKKWIYYIK